MIDMKLTVEGIDDAVKELQSRGENVLAIVEKPIDRGAFRVEAALKRYPSPPQNSRYRRTGTLGRRWTTRPYRQPGLVGREVGNNTWYGPYVQSSQLQSHVHRGRWMTDEQALEQQASNIIDDVRNALRAAT